MDSRVTTFRKWKEVAEGQNFQCFYCNSDFLSTPQAYASVVQEHFYPQSKGGTKVVLSCQFCNMVKQDREFNTPEEAKEALKKLREEFLQKYEFKELKAKHRGEKQ